MEAVNLGARLAGEGAEAVAESVELLGKGPSFRPSVDAWLAPAREVLADGLDARDTLGIPTWHYGHEPSNVFATAIAKYLHNATREAILLEMCDAGIVFLPGAAGTVQEVFQDACENYYADETSVAPMVLVGRTLLDATLPAWPLLQALARGRAMEDHVHLVDSVEEATELMTANRAHDAGQPSQAQTSVAASWPQAPSISRPRVSRTVVGMPLASRRRTNSRSSAGSEAVHFEPGRRVERDQVDVHPAPVAVGAQDVGEQVGPPALVVDAAHHGVLDGDPALGPARVLPGGVHRLGDRVPGVDRHQLVAQLVVGGVQAEREGHRDALVGELPHPGHQADRRDGDAARGHAEPVRRRVRRGGVRRR